MFKRVFIAIRIFVFMVFSFCYSFLISYCLYIYIFTVSNLRYGDRSPKSPYARAFCIIWILLGIVLISLFTGLITAALSVSATPVFKVNGAKVNTLIDLPQDNSL